ncbi:hypothetical protein Z517_07070 [Fonsecaea pedrosoi CBS 271.37]|uniref:Enoyl reductase (ER) domain-containing protein n=1 Tax=Fonsecaea pedrosoi CBS 271.37 TaxID=1442368 RepID=A0A0D2H768_9EURO|nr:uncharacterized protein Z517_07070 [Fonsecaea pedrosoi CBS 271.37]KIW80454.1 hypothetical protein Z517_07070 [Fonsecaea pedrosoi CBS 271.37]
MTAQFKGYAVESASTWDKPKVLDIEPPPFGPFDVDVKISYCGVCGSDLLTVQANEGNDNWPGTAYPIVVGHEIVGEAVRVGEKVSKIRPGQIVGVGVLSSTCGTCRLCNSDRENYCSSLVETYNSKYSDGSISHGGYANYKRIHEDFVFVIPEGLELTTAAPLLCAGLTVYAPLEQAKVGPAQRVGVIGIGGLGHFAILFAQAMGATVTAISHSENKRADCEKMGVSKFINTSASETWVQDNAKNLDILISTTFADDFALESYLELLDVGGRLVILGLSESKLPRIPAGLLIGSNLTIVGSMIGSKTQMERMLALAAKIDMRAWVEVMPMRDCGKALEKVASGKARYRCVLEADL